MLLQTTRFGPMEVDETRIITFPKGMLGFPSCKRFALLEPGADTYFWWLQSVDTPDLAFVVAPPGKLVADYQPELGRRELDAIGAASASEVLVLAIANFSGGEACLNLAAPVLVNARTRRAAQVVLQDPRWGIRTRIGAQ